MLGGQQQNKEQMAVDVIYSPINHIEKIQQANTYSRTPLRNTLPMLFRQAKPRSELKCKKQGFNPHPSLSAVATFILF